MYYIMSSPFHVYLDLEVRNDDIVPTDNPPPLSFDETRLQPFLKGDASDYFCTIARFTLQTSNSIPIFIPEIDWSITPSTSTPTTPPYITTIYKITVKQAESSDPDKVETASLVYTPSDTTLPVPVSEADGTSQTNRFYYVNNYQQLMDMINNAFISLFGKVHIRNLGHDTPPYMEWDSASATASLNADQYYFDLGFGPHVTTQWEIYFNSRLYDLFNTLPATLVNTSGDLNYRLNMFGNPGNLVQQVTKDSSGNQKYNIIISQELSTISNMSPFDSIVFTSTSLPIIPQQSSTPKVITSDNKVITGNGLPNIANVLTDFQLPLSATNHYKPVISYAPAGEYRLIDMYGNTDLRRIDLQVFWKDKKGVMHPLLLYPGCFASVKMLFRSKHFYLGQ